MIRINLLGAAEGVQSGEKRRQLKIAGSIVGANVVVGIIVALIFGRVASDRVSELAEVERAIEGVLKIVHDVEDEEQQRTLLREKRRVIADLENRGVGPLRILKTLSESTPDRLWIEEFVDRSGQVTITGLAVDDPTVAEFLGLLQGSPYFDGLQLVETAQALQGSTTVKKFVMKGPLRYSPNGEMSAEASGDGAKP